MSFKLRLQRALPVWRQLLQRSTPFVRMSLISGGSAGEHTVTGIKKGDQLVSVLESEASDAVLTDRTAEFVLNTDRGWIIQKDDTIDNTDGTDTTSDNLLVTWVSWGE